MEGKQAMMEGKQVTMEDEQATKEDEQVTMEDEQAMMEGNGNCLTVVKLQLDSCLSFYPFSPLQKEHNMMGLSHPLVTQTDCPNVDADG